MLKQLLTMSCLALSLGALPAMAIPLPPANQATLVIGGNPVVTLVPVGYYTAESRMAEVQRRLVRSLKVDRTSAVGQFPYRVADFDVNRDIAVLYRSSEPVIYFRGLPLITITKPDAMAQGMSVPQLTANTLRNLKTTLAHVTPESGMTLKQTLRQIAVLTTDRAFTAADQTIDEGS